MQDEDEKKSKADKKHSPYKKWVQVNNDKEAYEAEEWLLIHSPTAYRVLKFLVANMDKYNAIVCSYKVMQEKLNCSKATIERAIKTLKEHKYLDIKKTGTSNVYLINKRLYWNSWGSNYAYAEFGAKIILSSSEQDEEDRKEIQTQIAKYQEVKIKEELVAAR